MGAEFANTFVFCAAIDGLLSVGAVEFQTLTFVIYDLKDRFLHTVGDALCIFSAHRASHKAALFKAAIEFAADDFGVFVYDFAICFDVF